MRAISMMHGRATESYQHDGHLTNLGILRYLTLLLPLVYDSLVAVKVAALFYLLLLEEESS